MRGSAAVERRPDAAVVERRAVLRTAAIGSLVAGTGITSLLGNLTEAHAAGSFVPDDPNLHLLRRATYGPTPKALSEIRRMGADGWLARQLDPRTIDDRACDELIGDRFPRLGWSIAEATQALEFGWDLMFDVGVAAIVRAAWSERQLFETMVDFWSNHLNVTNPSDTVWANRHDYDRTVIRRHALGRFSELLVASATHPAMMTYLNNAESTKDLPNENYGRELLELHSVGVDAGYSEGEMYESALIMTGFGVDWETNLFEYFPDYHYTGHVKVLEWSSNNRDANGYRMALDYVRYLAHHPATARRIATKLCERFVSDRPSPRLVSDLARTYLRHGTAIVPVLQQLFTSDAFGSSIGAKVRRPMQDVVATLRILGMGPDPSGGTDGLQGLYWMISDLGDTPMAWSQPNGYPDVADAWRSAGGTLGRWHSHMSLATGWYPSDLAHPDLRRRLLPAHLPRTHGKLLDLLAQRLVFRSLSSHHRSAVLGFLDVGANAPVDEDSDAVNERLPAIVSLILDSPYFQVR
ncbi:MAG: DUF1800 domain-containing protein [Actinomycetota bacterium]